MTKIAKKGKVFEKRVDVKNFIEAKVKSDVLPLPTTTVNSEEEHLTHLLKPRAVTTGVYALLEVIKRREDGEKKKTLFKDDPKDIMLQIVPIKIPKTDMQQLRVVLPHPLTVEGSDVCLITQNVKKATKNDHEPTIAYYKSLLQEKKVKGITEIVPIRQLRSEHVPFEMKGRFADMYDMFLVDGRLFGKVTKFLGSRFFKKNKDLIPVKINTDNVKEELEKALAKTVLTVHGHGDTYSVKVGFSSFTLEQLEANIYAVADTLLKSFPGGFINIRKLLIKSDHSMAIPIYISLTPNNSVKVPVVKPHLPKAYVPVEGDLTTHIGHTVTVLPTGEVFVKRAYTEEDIEMGYSAIKSKSATRKTVDNGKIENNNEDKDEEPKLPKAKGKKRKADDESSDDDDVEAAENAYVSELRNEPKQRGQAKSVGTAQSKKEKVTSKRQATKSKKEEGETHDSPVDEAPDKVGVKRKKSNIVSKVAKVNKQPTSLDESKMVEVKRKKLNAKSKVKPAEVDEQMPAPEEADEQMPAPEEAGSLSPKNVKATPKAQLRKAKKHLKKDAKVLGSPNMVKKLTPSNDEGLDSSQGQFVKAKKQATLGKGAKKQLKKTAKVLGSPNTINLTPSKEEEPPKNVKATPKAQLRKAKKQLKKDVKVLGSPNTITKLTPSKKQADLGNGADMLGTTLETTPTSVKRPTETMDLLNDMVTDQEKKKKLTKETSNQETSRLGIMFNMLKQSRIDSTQSKEVNHSLFNEVDFPTNSKLNIQDTITHAIETSSGKTPKRMKTGENSYLSLEVFGSPAIETTADKKKKKRVKRTTNDGDAALQSLGFGSPPSTMANKEKKSDKRAMKVDDSSVNSMLLKIKDVGSPAITTNTDKKKKKLNKKHKIASVNEVAPVLGIRSPTDKKKRKKKTLDKLMTNTQKTPNSVSHLLDFESPAIKTSIEKKKKKQGKRASLGKETSANSTMPFPRLEMPMTEENAKKIKKGDKLVTTIDEGSVNSILRSLDVGIPTIDRHTDTQAKDKLDQSLKIKKFKRLQDKSVPPTRPLDVLMSKQKEMRQVISQEDSPQHVKIAKALDNVSVGKSKSVPTVSSIQPTRSKSDFTEEYDLVKENPEKIEKRKENPIAPVELEENVSTPKPKKKKKRISKGLARNVSPMTKAASLDLKVPAIVGEPTPLSSDKSPKSKDKAKDKKPSKKSKGAVNEKQVDERKAFPRYFSEESQKTLSKYDVKATTKRLEPQDKYLKMNVGEALPHYIGVAGKSDMETMIANAKRNKESVITMPMELLMLLQSKKKQPWEAIPLGEKEKRKQNPRLKTKKKKESKARKSNEQQDHR